MSVSVRRNMKLQTMPLRFRVWNKEEKEFVPSDYDWEFAIRIDGGISHHDGVIDYGWQNRFIISQDTGLKDKNGKNIYFGDILQWGKTIGYVDMFKGHIVLDIRTSPSHAHLLYDIQNDTTVVGNIWQNPELLEEK